MAEEILASVQVRRDNKANWEAVNPILLDGEAAYEKDTDMFKIGDGVNNYKNLPYHNKVGPKGDTGATPQISMSVSTGAAGSEASVSVSGTAENPLISLTIPRGDTGASGVTEETDPTVPAWAKQPSKPTYTAGEVGARPDTWMPSAADVGADAAGTASGAVAAHNTSGAAHANLRALIEGLNNRLNALADSDDTTLDQLSEIVAYIKNNKALIDAVTTGKVSVSDIVDDLTTNASGKVLSAAQGVALKAMIDGIVIPTALPNPQPITINGQRYDGSEAVTVTVSSEGGGTPVEIDDTLTQSGKAADAKVVGDRLSALNQAKANDADLAKVAKSGSYDDLINKPKIPTVPESLKNPNKLILSGAVTAEYDGSSEVRVEIPAGGGSAYELPIASATQLGGVMPVAKTDEMTQAVGVDDAGGLWTKAGGGGGESEFAGTETLLASGTIPSGTEAMSITDSGVTYDEFLKHRYVKVTFKSTENNYPQYSFRGNPSAAWHLNPIGDTEATGHFTIFEPVGKLLRPAMTLSSVYSTLGNDGFEFGNYNIDPRSALISYDRWHAYQGSDTMKFAFASKATTADWNWWIYALD